MSVPEYVPTLSSVTGAILTLPQVPPGGQRAGRPGELGARPFTPGAQQGRTGPDARYALALARRSEPEVALAPGERVADALDAAAAIAMSRAAAAGRGPVGADLVAGRSLLGYLGGARDNLIEWRGRALELLAGDYQRLRRLVALSAEVLGMEPPPYAPTWAGRTSFCPVGPTCPRARSRTPATTSSGPSCGDPRDDRYSSAATLSAA